MSELTCLKCGHTGEPLVTESGPHRKASCPECGEYIKFLPQGGEPSLWFGKYKGKTIAEIRTADENYCRWLLTQDWLKRKDRAAIEAELSK